MNKPRTLLGYMAETIKNIEEVTKEGTEELASTEDVRDIISEMVNETYLNSVVAKSAEPTTETLGGVIYFFANGTPVTIEEKEDGSEGAVVKWDGGSVELEETSRVFGGRHNNTTMTNTSVVMNGGKIHSVFGGGMHKSHTVKAHVVINGGYLKDVYGGGAASYTKECGCSWAAKPETAVCITEDANVEIHGGEGMTLVFGGGEGMSYTKKCHTVVDGDPSIYYFTTATTNGKSDECSSVINGGTIAILQGINRGVVGTVNTVVNSGKIGKAFVGGEIPFIGSKDKPNGNDPSGTFKSATLVINGGKIDEISLGGNDYAVITEESPCFSNTFLVDNRK